MCKQYFHRNMSYFQLDCLNLWLEGSFSFCPSYDSLSSTLDVVSSIFPWCGNQWCNDTMVARIFTLMCSGFCLLLFAPFPLLFPLLGSFSVLFLLRPTWLPFVLAYVSSNCACTHAFSIFLGLKSITCFLR
jgi:hypothetical protein